MSNLYDAFYTRFKANPDQVALVSSDGAGLSYHELQVLTGKFARYLIENNISPGDRVSVIVEKSTSNIALYLACLQVGAIYQPLNTAYRSSELEFFFNDATPSLVICSPKLKNEMAGIDFQYDKPILATLDESGYGDLYESSTGLSPCNEVTERSGDDTAALLYTSGTTGRSKGAMLTHQNLLSNALTLHAYWSWREGDILLHVLPLFHVHGLFVALHCALLNTSKILLLPRFDTAQVINKLKDATVFMGVPTYYTRLLNEPAFTADVCVNMRLFIAGSAPLHPDTFLEFRQRTGLSILERYGMTETCMITSNPVNGERRQGTVGLPLPEVNVQLVDDENKEVSKNQVGQLTVKGPNVFHGYWNMPGKKEEDMTGAGYFITGDLATIDEDGYVSIVGRSKDMIISGGFNVYPKEIEIVLDKEPGISESAVVGVPHPDFGEAVVAVIVLNAGEKSFDESRIKKSLKQQLASYKIPKRIIVISELPRNSMGKVQKNVIRDQYANLYN